MPSVHIVRVCVNNLEMFIVPWHYHFSDGVQVREQVSIGKVLCDETERFLFSDTSNQSDNVRVAPLSNALHKTYLIDKILPLWSIGKAWNTTILILFFHAELTDAKYLVCLSH